MATNETETAGIKRPSGLSPFLAKEDWWAVWLGLGAIILAYVFYLSGSAFRG